MVNAGPALFNEARDRRIGTIGLEQFDECIPGCEAGNARAVTVREGYLMKSEYVAKERESVAKGAHGKAKVRNGGAARGIG